jgi:hypothetical protein
MQESFNIFIKVPFFGNETSLVVGNVSLRASQAGQKTAQVILFSYVPTVTFVSQDFITF